MRRSICGPRSAIGESSVVGMQLAFMIKLTTLGPEVKVDLILHALKN